MWWRAFEADVGILPGLRPEAYWVPRVAEFCHLRPTDLADLTAAQLQDTYRYSNLT